MTNKQIDIETLEVENRLLRARNERLEREALSQDVQEPMKFEEKLALLIWDYQELERAFNKLTGGTWIRKKDTPPAAQPAPTQEHQINQLEKFKNHVLTNANALGVVLDAPTAPVQEPLAFFHPFKGFYWSKPTKITAPVTVDVEPLPLYATPPAQPALKPLTDEQILKVARDHYSPHQRPEISFARAIEAAHGIKE